MRAFPSTTNPMLSVYQMLNSLSLYQRFHIFLKSFDSGYLAFDYLVYKVWTGQLDSLNLNPGSVTLADHFSFLSFFSFSSEKWE